MELDPEAAWQMSKEEEMSQREANAHARTGFMDRLVTGMTGEPVLIDGDTDDDAPQSTAEAEADAEAARMNLLLDRVTARLERKGHANGSRYWLGGNPPQTPL